ncbi:hypothetical protein QQ056_13065 [Oscillatoria laete-virens NRMC-F 0139]|nr:hypothetical protein [Oscillatoria laete-virens]MDL5054468.1 hypothetical protein [Oscillatoria laete-virens NRMC-F 0139]
MDNEKDKLWELLGSAKKVEPSPWFTDHVLRQVERMEQSREEYVSVPRFFWKFATAFGVFAIAGAIFLTTPVDHQIPVTPTASVVQIAPPPAPTALAPAQESPLLVAEIDAQEALASLDSFAHTAEVSLPDAAEMAVNPAIQNPVNKVHDLNLIQTGFETASGLGTHDFFH